MNNILPEYWTKRVEPAEQTTGRPCRPPAASNACSGARRRLPPTVNARLKSLRRSFIASVKNMDGDPHYLATGMAVGVFIGCTPTIPLQTILAIALAFILNGSKPAAVVGIWVCNPITLPLFYFGGFKLGSLILGRPIPFDLEVESISTLIHMGFDVTLALIIGGVFIGILPAAGAYLITRRLALAAIEKRARTKPKGSTTVS